MSQQRSTNYKQMQKDYAEIERLLAQARHAMPPLPNPPGVGHGYGQGLHGHGAGALPGDPAQRRVQSGYQPYTAAPAVPAETMPDVVEVEVRLQTSCRACSVCSVAFVSQQTYLQLNGSAVGSFGPRAIWPLYRGPQAIGDGQLL